MKTLSGTALGDYGATIFERDHFTCAYCGFDGRLFDNWMQLSVDHILPQSLGGHSGPENIITACRACNSITSRMRFPGGKTREQILEDKRSRVAERREKFYDWWLKGVAPLYLDRPLPPIARPVK
jgi:5-methylcytosine-specific restriction endonuclease McrA